MTQLLDAAALESAAEFKVQAVLDKFLRQRSNESEFAGQIIAICREQPNAAWQALASLDQLHRRSVLPTELYLGLKEKLNELVFCSTGTYIAVPSRRPNSTEISKSKSESEFESIVDSEVGEHDSPRSEQTSRALPKSANAVSFRALHPGLALHDRYLLLETIAIGAATVTFKARDQLLASLPQAEQIVAIRCLADHLQNDPHAIVALQNECAHLQGIAHPNIPKVHDIHDALGDCSLVLDMPEGELLNGIIERGMAKRLDPSLALTLVREIGFALANAHDFGLAHGVLHPGQVLITRDGGIRVYGFAQADWWALAGAELWSGESIAVSPPNLRRYLSPRRRNVLHAIRSDDLYSLACIAFELLTGQPVEMDAARVYGAHRPKNLRHLSDRQWSALRRGLAEDPRERGRDIRVWLNELGLDQARWRLPPLAEFESEIH